MDIWRIPPEKEYMKRSWGTGVGLYLVLPHGWRRIKERGGQEILLQVGRSSDTWRWSEEKKKDWVGIASDYGATLRKS